MSNHFVYMLRCKDNSLYTGYTVDMERRLEEHQLGKGAKYTRGRGPFEMVYMEQYTSKSEAMQREAEIKKLSRAAKLRLIAKGKGIHGLDSI